MISKKRTLAEPSLTSPARSWDADAWSSCRGTWRPRGGRPQLFKDWMGWIWNLLVESFKKNQKMDL